MAGLVWGPRGAPRPTRRWVFLFLLAWLGLWGRAARALPCALTLEERGRFAWPRTGAEAGLSFVVLPRPSGGALLWVGAPGDWAGGEEAGAVALLEIDAGGAARQLGELRGEAGDWLGAAMSLLPDLDGDGLPELAVGAPASGELLLLAGHRWAGPELALEGPSPRLSLVPGQGARLRWRGEALWVGEDDEAAELPLGRRALSAALLGESGPSAGAPSPGGRRARRGEAADRAGSAGAGRAGAGAGAPVEGGRGVWDQSGAHEVGDWDEDGVKDVVFISRTTEQTLELRAASGRCAARWAGEPLEALGATEQLIAALPAWSPARSGLRPTEDVGRPVVVAGPVLALGAPRSGPGGLVLLLGPAAVSAEADRAARRGISGRSSSGSAARGGQGGGGSGRRGPDDRAR